MARTAHSLRVSRRLVAALALTGAVAAAGQAMAIPNGGGTGVPLNEPPVAKVTATPNPVVVPPQLVAAPITSNALPADLGDAVIRFGTSVSFDASGSFDDDGNITKYEWDLDGQPGFEKTTTTPRTTQRFSAPGNTTARVRVTDNRNATDTASTVVVAHRAPVARIAASKTVAVVGDGVTFTSGSTDDNGIAALDWDLDGDGTFERSGPQVATSFGTTGPHPVALRVTDTLGARSTATVTIRVHRAPTALLVTNPVIPVVNQQTVLDGSRSTDDGTIARYQWDLNGDGTFETDTAAVPRATTTFTRTGPATVGLKVTDGDGATDQTTLRVQVAATPAAAIDRTAPSLRPLSTSFRMNARKRIAVKVACPAGEQLCTVGAQLRGVRGALAGKSLGRARIQMQGGSRATLSIPLSAKAQKAVRRGTLTARVVLTTTDQSGNRAVTRTGVTIRK